MAKRFASDADVKQVVAFWLRQLTPTFFYAGVFGNVRSISSKSFRLCATVHKIHMVINVCEICERVD
jgi:hypothetical protein